jgi:hypothetical protein
LSALAFLILLYFLIAALAMVVRPFTLDHLSLLLLLMFQMQLTLVIMRMMKQRKLLLQGLQKNSDPSVGKSLIQFLSMELLCRQDANIVMNS